MNLASQKEFSELRESYINIYIYIYISVYMIFDILTYFRPMHWLEKI